MGRPSKYSDAILKQICERLSDGEPLAEICRDEGLPAARTVYDWMDGETDGIDGNAVTAAIAHARKVGFDAIASRVRQTARGKTAEEGGDSSGDVQRDKLIVDTDLKLLSKWDPKRYGDLIKLSGADGSGPVPMLQITADMTPAQAAEAYSKLLG